MAIKLLRVLDWRNWWAVWSGTRAIFAYHGGDCGKAARHFYRMLRVERFQTSEHMAFHAFLLTLSGASRKDVTQIYSLVAAGAYRKNAEESRYAEALAHYFLAYLTKRQDVVARWLDAYALRPSKGFASRYLPLPDKPLFK